MAKAILGLGIGFTPSFEKLGKYFGSTVQKIKYFTN
jgi:hypothetical protein